MKQLKVYYAHCVSLYGTKQEASDVKMLESMGFEVMNPGSKEFLADLEAARKNDRGLLESPFAGGDRLRGRWQILANSCHGLAFRSYVDGTINADLHTQIREAINRGKFVFELPRQIDSRALTSAQTRAVLLEIQ